jgi:hypothetical protein
MFLNSNHDPVVRHGGLPLLRQLGRRGHLAMSQDVVVVDLHALEARHEVLADEDLIDRREVLLVHVGVQHALVGRRLEV